MVTQPAINFVRRVLPFMLVAVLVACGGSPSAPSQSALASAPVDEGDNAALYGLGPRPDPSITYQPDVVVVTGGPDAIRAVSPDGLTWTVDAAADGLHELAAGKVMFLTSQAVGRVVRTEARDGVVDVTLAPVELGEVIRDGHLVLDQEVPLDALTLYDAPRFADGFEDAPSSELTGSRQPVAAFAVARDAVEAPPVAFAAAAAAGGAWPETADAGATSQASTKVGDWTLSAYRTSETVGLRAERGVASVGQVSGADLKVAIDAHLEAPNLRVVADIPVSRGEVGTSHFRVLGIDGLFMSVQAGAVNGLSDNRKARVEVPVQLRQNVIIGGFPAVLTQRFKFLVETAFTAKNGTLTASGEWDVGGSIGIDGQTLTLPTLTPRGVHLIDSLAGVSVGVNGIVVAVSFEFGLLIGLPVAGAGPVAAFITSLGLTNGSSLGIVQCRQASITSLLSAGVGLQVFDPVKEALKRVIGYEVPAQHQLVSKTVLEERWVKPDVVACRG